MGNDPPRTATKSVQTLVARLRNVLECDRAGAPRVIVTEGVGSRSYGSALGEHPLRERLWALLVHGLFHSGRQGDALAAYERARTLVTEELGVDPGPELRELHRKVLAQDPMLAHRPRLTCGDAEDGGYAMVANFHTTAMGERWCEIRSPSRRWGVLVGV